MTCLDPYGRKLEYVRLSVTDKCNLRCFYCLPERHRAFATPAHYLTFDEIEQVMAAFADLGVTRVRLTGGEPLVRKNVVDLVGRLAALPGIDDLSMSTNALLLADKAGEIFDAGVERLNVSLDTLKEDRFRQITHGGEIGSVLTGLQKAKLAGFDPIKINMLVMKGINDDEIIDMAVYCLENSFALRFIETMPIGANGRKAYQHYLSLETVRETLANHFDLIPSLMPGGGPARYVRVRGTDTHFGFITPLSQHFCATCNRVRLAVDGTLHLCLGNSHNFELRPHLRSGISHDGLKQLILEALARKPRQHNFVEDPDSVDRAMSATGG